jgi:glycosyltransferase involved in cell wall biosynthesis
MKPILSILIPTRNRTQELNSLLSIIDLCNSGAIEFIVSDNSDIPHEFLSRQNVKFLRPTSILNMKDHWNFLLSHAKGRFITFLGDDDAFIPSEIIRLGAFADSCTADLIWTRQAGYAWPVEEQEGVFFQEIRNNPKTQDFKEMRSRILRIQHGTEIPVPYCRVLFHERVIEKWTTAFSDSPFCVSRIPDISAGVKIAFLAESQVHYNYTVFISGSSKSSNGGLTRQGLGLDDTHGFNNLKFNPLTLEEFRSLLVAPPFGYITWFEAFEESIRSLRLRSRSRTPWIAFKSAFYSSNFGSQMQISSQVWPQWHPISSMGFVLGSINRRLLRHAWLWRKFQVGMKIIFRKSSFVILGGEGIPTTFALVKFLERTEVLRKKERLVKVVVSK